MGPKQAIAKALAKKYKVKKMSDGGIVASAPPPPPPPPEPTGRDIFASAFKKQSHFAMGGEVESPEEEEQTPRDLEELQADGYQNPGGVSNPTELREAMGFADALRRMAGQSMSTENYAMGGLVQDGTEENKRLNGTRPEENMSDETEEPMGDEPAKVSDHHGMTVEPSGPELSPEALEALKKKKMNRRFGAFNPR